MSLVRVPRTQIDQDRFFADMKKGKIWHGGRFLFDDPTNNKHGLQEFLIKALKFDLLGTYEEVENGADYLYIVRFEWITSQ